MHNRPDRINNIRKQNRSEADRLSKNSAVLFKNSMEEKIRTTMIYSLSVFEKLFGDLWGHGKQYDDLTLQERDMRKLWEAARNSILDKGNAKLRDAQDELSQYKISWGGYKFKLPVKETRRLGHE